MDLDEFIEFLDTNGVEYHTTDKSVVFKESPCCGRADRIYMFKDSSRDGGPFWGKCMGCETDWNSKTYLVDVGVDEGAVTALHGARELGEFKLSTLPRIDTGVDSKQHRTEPETPVPLKEFDVSGFFQVSDWPDHEAAKYAVSRGWTPAWTDKVMIDIMANAVVFVCIEDGKVVGYQKRFVRPKDPKTKTKSVAGWKKTQHVITFPGNGDIAVCEGPFNSLSAWHYGRYGVATFGSAVSERQVDMIAAIAKKEGKDVGIAFDLDAAGRKGYRRLRLSLFWRGVNAYQVRPEVGNDLNDSWKAGKGIIVTPFGTDDVTIPDIDLEDIVTGRI